MAYMFVGLLFAVLVAVFALQNATLVNISFLFWTFPKIELVLVILFSAFLGAIFMFIFSLSHIWRLGRRHRNELSSLKETHASELAAAAGSAQPDAPAPTPAQPKAAPEGASTPSEAPASTSTSPDASEEAPAGEEPLGDGEEKTST